MNMKLEEIIEQKTKDKEAAELLKKEVQDLIDEKNKVSNYLNLLEAAIRNDYDSILITDLSIEKPGPKIVYVNDGFIKMTGYSREEAIGQTPRILQGPKTDRATLDKLKKNLEEGKSFFGQTVNYRKDGSEFINQWDIHPLVDNDGTITHWVSYQHDITERKRAEQNIFEGDTDVNDAYESSKRTIIDVNKDGNIIFANKSFRELSGYTKEELIKHKLWDLLPNKQQSALSAMFVNLWENDASEKKVNVILRHKNGSPIQVELVLKKMTLDGGAILRADVRNLSLRKKVLENLRLKNEKFSKIFQPAKEFSYGLYLENNDMIISWVSESFSDITGYSESEVSGKDGLLGIIHEDDRQRARQHLKKATDGISSCEIFRIISKSGLEIPVMDYVKKSGEAELKGVVTETELQEA